MANKYSKGELKTGTTGERKVKDHSRKHAHVRDQWIERKRQGRPKQAWVGATLAGKPFVPSSTAEIEQAITAETIGSYVSAHWEKETA
jgi:hypothetical protein